MKYIGKPIEIEATQYTRYGKLVPGMCNSQSCYAAGNPEPHVHTIHNNQLVTLVVGDYVIIEPDGEHAYPCKEDIFLNKYYEKPNINDVELPEHRVNIIKSEAQLYASEYHVESDREKVEKIFFDGRARTQKEIEYWQWLCIQKDKEIDRVKNERNQLASSGGDLYEQNRALFSSLQNVVDGGYESHSTMEHAKELLEKYKPQI